MKKLLVILMACTMVLSTLVASVYAASFSDLSVNHWAYQYISPLVDLGVINGYDDGTYKPNGTVKRGEFVKLVISSCFEIDDEIKNLKTELDHWSAPYVYLAETYEVIPKGSINIANIEEPITRIEMVRMISNADIIMKDNLQQFETPTTFSDLVGISLSDEYLLRHAVSRGLITGYEDGTFKPQQTMTRAEAATMIYRFTR